MEKLGTSVKMRRFCRKAALTNATYKTFPPSLQAPCTRPFSERKLHVILTSPLTPIHTACLPGIDALVVKNTIKLVKFVLELFNECS